MIRSYGDETFFFTTCDSDEHCSMDATVTLLYVEQVTAVCLYFNLGWGLRQGPGKYFWGPGKSWNLF